MAAKNNSFTDDYFYPDNDQSNNGLNVNTGQVENTVHVVMGVILFVIVIFLVVHVFIRFHYKAKTEYALNELREKFEKNGKGPSAFAMPKDPEIGGKKITPPRPVEIMLEPDQLAPILHQVALAPPGRIEEAQRNVYYKANNL